MSQLSLNFSVRSALIFFIAVLLFHLPWKVGAQGKPSGHRLNLKETLQYAERHSPAFDSPNRKSTLYDLEAQSAYRRFFPSLDLTATHGLRDDSPRTREHPWASELALELTENLYDHGVTFTKYKIAQLQKRQSELISKDDLNQLTLELTLAFVQFSRLDKLLEVRSSHHRLLAKEFGFVSEAYHRGVKTRRDFLRFKAQLMKSDIELSGSKDSLQKMESDLRILIGVKDSSSLILFEPLRAESPTSVSTNDLELSESLEFRSLSLQKEIHELEADLVRRKYWPEIGLSAQAKYGAADYLGTGNAIDQVDFVEWNFLFTLNYNLWDWGIRKRDRQVANLQAQIKNNEVQTKVQALEQKLDQTQRDLRQLQKNVALASELLMLEQQNVTLLEREYRNGKVSYLDMIEAFRGLLEARVGYYENLFDLQKANYTSLHYQGTLYEVISK